MGKFRRLDVTIAGLGMLAVVALSGPAQAQEGGWRYGEHPLWGLSAWATANGESVGLRCLPARGRTVPVAAIMFTKGLVTPMPPAGPQSTPEGSVAYKFIDTEGWGMLTIASTRGGYYEHTGTTCDVNLDEFRTGSELVFVDPSVDAETMRTKPMSELKVLARFTLAGAKAATDKLIAACAAIRRDIANKCGI